VKLGDFGNAICIPPDEMNRNQIPTSSPTPSDISSSTSSSPLSPIQTPISASLTDGIGRGTQSYSAPELYSGKGIYSYPIDIYSLGVTLYTLITGQEPFSLAKSSVHMMMGIRKGFFESGMQNLPHDDETMYRYPNAEIVDSKIIHLLKTCLHRDPNLRPTASQLVIALAELDDFIPVDERIL